MLQEFRGEITRVENQETLPRFRALGPPQLEEMRKTMFTLKQAVQKEESESVVGLVNNLKAYAQSRSSEFTRQGDIETAVAWRDWEQSLQENAVIASAYEFSGGGGDSVNRGRDREQAQPDVHDALSGSTARIITDPQDTFSGSPRVYWSGAEPKGKEKRIQRASTPNAKGAGHTKLTAQILLIEEEDTLRKSSSILSSYKEKELTFVPRIKMSPLVGQSLDRTLVVFDLYKRGLGSKRGVIRTDQILLPPLASSDTVVVDAGTYKYETEEYDSRYSSYDYESASADEFYGYIVTIFNKDGEMIYQRATERVLDDYARETPP
ncbi:MAG: hypothetical protein ACO3N7_00840 [Kiritimatiellia bacterium]